MNLQLFVVQVQVMDMLKQILAEVVLVIILSLKFLLSPLIKVDNL